MKKLKNRLFLGSFCLFLGFRTCSNLAIAHIQRFKTDIERAKIISKHEKKLTLGKLDKRLTKVEMEIKRLKNNQNYSRKLTITDCNN